MQIIKASEQEGIELLYRGKSLHNIAFENTEVFNKYAEILDVDTITDSIEYSKQFDIPQHYKEIDVEQFVKGLIPQCGDSDVSVKARVEEELALYKARNLYPVLQLMIYIVDTMRKHNLVWGVGRGSSVASYCLYLIGVHKIDSVKYNLNIREFLK